MRFPTGLKFNIQCFMLCIKICISYIASQKNSNILTSMVIATNGFSLFYAILKQRMRHILSSHGEKKRKISQ